MRRRRVHAKLKRERLKENKNWGAEGRERERHKMHAR